MSYYEFHTSNDLLLKLIDVAFDIRLFSVDLVVNKYLSPFALNLIKEPKKGWIFMRKVCNMIILGVNS